MNAAGSTEGQTRSTDVKLTTDFVVQDLDVLDVDGRRVVIASSPEPLVPQSRTRACAATWLCAHVGVMPEDLMAALRSVATADAVADVDVLVVAGALDNNALSHLIELFEGERAAEQARSDSNVDLLHVSPVEEDWLRVTAVWDRMGLDPHVAGPTALVLHQLALRHGEYGGPEYEAFLDNAGSLVNEHRRHRAP